MNPMMQELSDTLADILNRVELNYDPIEQVVLAAELNVSFLAAQNEVAEVRRRAVRTLRAQGWGLREIGEAAGMSHQRVSQIEMGADRKEKASKK